MMTENDFEKRPFIYFDWNEIQNLKRRIQEADERTLYKLSKLKSDFIFPISEAHLLDLKKSNNYAEVKNDLDFLNFHFSNGYLLCYIGELDQYRILSFDKVSKEIPGICDVYRYYDLVSQDKNYEHMQKSIRIPEFPVELSKISDSYPLKPYLERNDGIINSNVLEDFLSDISNNINNPEYINNLNDTIRNINYSEGAAFQAFSNKEEMQKLLDDFIKYTRSKFGSAI